MKKNRGKRHSPIGWQEQSGPSGGTNNFSSISFLDEDFKSTKPINFGEKITNKRKRTLAT